MKKLFESKKIEIGSVVRNYSAEETDLDNYQLDITDYADDIEIATERFRTCCNDLNLLTDMSASLERKKSSSVDYFVSLENYSLVVSNIANNLNVRNKIPSLEDFKNPSGFNACHSVAIEGFFYYIKKIWEKIKEFFKAFFKKITLFFKRLTKANLELDEYEEYLEEMMSRIKNKKLVLSDNKVLLDSKLPSYFANEGMEEINSEFLLSTGQEKCKNLLETIKKVFDGSEVSKREQNFKNIKTIINGIITNKDIANTSIEEVKDQTDLVKKISLAVLDDVFEIDVGNNTGNIPNKVIGSANHFYNSEEMSVVTIRSLIDSNVSSLAIPKNFNMFYFRSSTDNKVYVSGSTELNTYVTNKIPPILNSNNLLKLYEFYKKFSKEVDLKKIDKTFDSLDKEVSALIDLMKSRYSNFLDELKNTKKIKSIAERVDDITTIKQAYSRLIQIYNSIPVPESHSGDKYEAAMYKEKELTRLFKEHMQGYSTTYISKDSDMLAGIISVHESPHARPEDILDIMKENHPNESDELLESLFVGNVKDFISKLGASTTTTDAEIDLTAHIEEFKKLQDFLINYLNRMQYLIKELAINLAGTHTEVRYELAKYIYNTAKLYNLKE